MFELTKCGKFKVLYRFKGKSDGFEPGATLVMNHEGSLFGSTEAGGRYGFGTVVKLSARGKLTVLHAFSGGSDGAQPTGQLALDSNGTLYGTAEFGAFTGCYDGRGCGTLFSITDNGSFTVLHSFAGGADGGGPVGDLMMDKAGSLYGTTAIGGDITCVSTEFGEGCGTVFESHSGSAKRTDSPREDGQAAMTDPSQHGDSIFVALVAGIHPAVLLGLALMLVCSHQSALGQTFTVLYSFAGGADGAYPYAALLRADDSILYGTTYLGGVADEGTVFRINLDGQETVLHSFTGRPDGAHPYAGLIGDRQGNIYGTTDRGGIADGGTVFTLDSKNDERVLYSFCNERYCNDGVGPRARLIRDAKGNFYGTTIGGGAFSGGLVFKLDQTGRETILYSFGFFDGFPGYATLVRDAAGNIYDTTVYGGDFDCSYFYVVDCGSVFRLTPRGDFTVLHSFEGKRNGDGEFPYAGLLAGGNGEFYGTTSAGGSYGAGTVFEVHREGKESVLHSFGGTKRDGANPVAGLIGDKQGNLYGTTLYGGAHNMGTVYRLNRRGKFTVLHSFKGIDGENPFAGLVLDRAGALYGTATLGGVSGAGAVFKLTLR